MENMIPSLRDKATAVKLVRHMYNASMCDKAVTNDIDNAKGTTRAGKYLKKLLKNCVELQEAQTAFGDVYQYVRSHTLPWMDDGMRLVPNSYYPEFIMGYKGLAQTAMDKVQKLADAWDAAVLADQNVLKGMWDPSDYPSKEEMMEKWELRLMPMPIPSSEDFRIDLDDADKALLDAKLEEVEAGATTHVIKEIFAPVKAMAERLNIPKGEKGSVFRNTLVGNLLDACDRATSLNINHDARVDEAIKEVRDIIGNTTADDLREDAGLRKEVGTKMSELEATMSSWF